MCNRSLPSIFDPPENLFQKTAKKKSKKSKESTERIDSNPTSNPISFHHPPESTPQPVDKSPKSAASIRASTGLRRPSAGASPGLRPSVRPGFTRVPSVRPPGLHPGLRRPSTPFGRRKPKPALGLDLIQWHLIRPSSARIPQRHCQELSNIAAHPYFDFKR